MLISYVYTHVPNTMKTRFLESRFLQVSKCFVATTTFISIRRMTFRKFTALECAAVHWMKWSRSKGPKKEVQVPCETSAQLCIPFIYIILYIPAVAIRSFAASKSCGTSCWRTCKLVQAITSSNMVFGRVFDELLPRPGSNDSSSRLTTILTCNDEIWTSKG